MTPGARVQSAIELLSAIEEGDAPADRLVERYFRRRRFAGSHDRAAIAGLVYSILRRRAEVDWWLEVAGAPLAAGAAGARRRAIAALRRLEGRTAAEIESLFDGGRFTPATLDEAERALLGSLGEAGPEAAAMPDWVRGNYPEWLHESLHARFACDLVDEMRALNERAPLDLRVNTLKSTREAVLARFHGDGLEPESCRLSRLGIRLRGRARITGHAAYTEGLVEVQDEGSQLVALLTDARPGMQVVDLCAGAGGKTLALAAEMANRGQVYACDASARRLGHMAPRLKRAGVRNVQTRHTQSPRDPWFATLEGKADRVLLDAPCSGSGVWRRNPDSKWRLGREALAGHVETQRGLLSHAAGLVRPGGRLVYATCSLLQCENEDRVDEFLARHSDFRPLCSAAIWAQAVGGIPPEAKTWLMLTPRRDGVDGFFVAVMERSPPHHEPITEI